MISVIMKIAKLVSTRHVCTDFMHQITESWNVFTMLETWQWTLSFLHSAESVSEILPDFLPLVNLGVVYTSGHTCTYMYMYMYEA